MEIRDEANAKREGRKFETNRESILWANRTTAAQGDQKGKRARTSEKGERNHSERRTPKSKGEAEDLPHPNPTRMATQEAFGTIAGAASPARRSA